MSKYDEVLKPFVSLMERELHANSGKGDRPGWLAMSAYDCMLEIYYHAAKLQKAIKDGNGDGIAEYSADVANMAMMVADICGAIHLAAPVVERQDVQVAAMPVERCYDIRVKMIMAFNEAKKNGGDLDDSLDAAYKSALRFSPNPLIAEQPAPVAADPEYSRCESCNALWSARAFGLNDGKCPSCDKVKELNQ